MRQILNMVMGKVYTKFQVFIVFRLVRGRVEIPHKQTDIPAIIGIPCRVRASRGFYNVAQFYSNINKEKNV